MKKYTQPAEKVFGTAFLICLCSVVTGAFLAILAPDQLDLIMLFLGLGISLGILSLTVYIVCRRSYLLLEEECVVFPITRAPKFTFKRNCIRYDEILKIDRISYKGDGVISKDTNFYKIVLKNGLEFTETFYSYGKKQEQEIVEWLKEKTYHT